ncbi:hypothetical protein NQ176_g7463 [Zarea fungicola]|uniref:Uncharacterized protein n=1 Tax=Zarea fungicola TaxID=93591 RepID=A0ACC1N0D2_9HYPO|nr:hypothetical protein NQ176_g7463 [Lecanicillium fungicola]
MLLRSINPMIVLASLATLTNAHSWVEEVHQIAPNGTLVGAVGYPRGWIARTSTDPLWKDAIPQWLLPSAGHSAYSGDEILNKYPYEANPKFPMLQASPGDHIALIHLENGHTTLPQNQPLKPRNRGTIFFYGTAAPKPQERLFMSTSGLSVAMSAESLKSLKYCLKWLRWTNGRMDKAIGSLKDALEEYESACNTQTRLDQGNEEADKDLAMNGTEGGSGTKTPEEARTEIANRIQVIKTDILKTLQEVTTTVSKYAGGTLPENARILVRRHLTSLPQRFRLATMSDANANGNTNGTEGTKDSNSALRDGAQKVLVLAREGLDMVTQITGVLDGTIVSAEEWCERMGKKRESDQGDDDMMAMDEKAPLPVMAETPSADVKMG